MSSPNIIPFDQEKGSSTVAGSYGASATPMRSDLIQQASKVIPDTPLLINIVSQRVRQSNQGRAPLVNTGGSRLGVADIALMEIIEGKIAVDEDGEPVDA